MVVMSSTASTTRQQVACMTTCGCGRASNPDRSWLICRPRSLSSPHALPTSIPTRWALRLYTPTRSIPCFCSSSVMISEPICPVPSPMTRTLLSMKTPAWCLAPGLQREKRPVFGLPSVRRCRGLVRDYVTSRRVISWPVATGRLRTVACAPAVASEMPSRTRHVTMPVKVRTCVKRCAATTNNALLVTRTGFGGYPVGQLPNLMPKG